MICVLCSVMFLRAMLPLSFTFAASWLPAFVCKVIVNAGRLLIGTKKIDL